MKAVKGINYTKQPLVTTPGNVLERKTSRHYQEVSSMNTSY